MNPATLFLTITLFHPGIEPRPVTVEFPMPDLATCVQRGDALARPLNALRRSALRDGSLRDSDDTRRFWYVCRVQS